MDYCELKEAAALDKEAKTHLEEELRVELEERQHDINTLNTKVALLRNQELASLVDIEHREENGARVNGAFQNSDDKLNQLTDLQDDMPNKEGSEVNDWQCETLERTECNDKRLNLSEEGSSLGSSEVRVEPKVLFRPELLSSSFDGGKVSVVTTSEMEDLQDLDITLPIQDCPDIPRPPRTSTPIPEDSAEPNFSNSSIIREHSYHLSSHRVTGVVRNRQCPLSNFMKQTWSETRVTKNPLLKKTSFKSKNIVKRTNPKRKFFTKQQLSIATNILYSSKRVYRMLRNQKLLDLPCIRTVYKHLERFKCPPGMNSEMKRLLTLFLLSLDPQDRICGVLFDEMKLAQLMSWSPRLKTVFKPFKVKS